MFALIFTAAVLLLLLLTTTDIFAKFIIRLLIHWLSAPKLVKSLDILVGLTCLDVLHSFKGSGKVG